MNINEINPNDFKSKISKMWHNIPLFIRLITFITIILYILNLFIPYISFYLSNVPYYTIFKINLWRIITTIFITTNLLNIILSLLFWVKFASELESSMGTIKYYLIFLMNSTIIQIFYTIISCLISFIINNRNYLLEKINNKKNVTNCGLWPNIISELTLLSLSNPNQLMNFLCFPCTFKAKYYPIIIFIIFSIMNSFVIDLEVLTGILYALLYHYLIKKKLTISDSLVLKFETSSACKCFTKMDGFVSVNNLGNKFVTTVNTINKNIKDISINQKKGFTPFQGIGKSLGGIINTDNFSGPPVQTTFTSIQKSQIESLDVKIK